MRVLVCGGRGYDDRDCVFGTLDRIHASRPIDCIIEGGAQGADYLACRWSASRRLPEHRRFHADWAIYGKAAGPIRNRRMIDEGKPDLVVAFPGGRGTADMVRRAKAAGVEVIEVAPAAPNDLRERAERVAQFARGERTKANMLATVANRAEVELRAAVEAERRLYHDTQWRQLQEANAVIDRLEQEAVAYRARLAPLMEALCQIEALDEASGHELRERHAFEAVAIARAAIRRRADNG